MKAANAGWQTLKDDDGRLQASCPTGMLVDNENSECPIATHDEPRITIIEKREYDGFFVPIILWTTMVCASLSNDEHGRRSRLL